MRNRSRRCPPSDVKLPFLEIFAILLFRFLFRHRKPFPLAIDQPSRDLSFSNLELAATRSLRSGARALHPGKGLSEYG